MQLEVSQKPCPERKIKHLPREVIVLRRMHIFRKINRVDAGATERTKIHRAFENGRSNLSLSRRRHWFAAIGTLGRILGYGWSL